MVDPAARAFSLDNGQALLEEAFDSVRCVRPDAPMRIVIRDPEVVAGYVASVADYYEADVTRPWAEVTESVRQQVAAIIERNRAFITRADVGAFICQ
jgi:hypothetical protein